MWSPDDFVELAYLYYRNYFNLLEGVPIYAAPPSLGRLLYFPGSGSTGSRASQELDRLGFRSYLVGHSSGEVADAPVPELATDPNATAKLTLTHISIDHVKALIDTLATLKIRNVTIKATLESGHTIVICSPPSPEKADVQEEVLKWAREKSTPENLGKALQDIEEHGPVNLGDKIREYRERRARRESKP